MNPAAGRGAGFYLGLAITLAFGAITLLAQFWTPFDPQALDISDKLRPPGWHHWFGTDQLGRDVLSLIMAGARNSLGVALLSTAMGLAVGVPSGLLAADRGGPVDDFIMRSNDIVFAFPALLLAILITAVLGPGAINAIVAIGIFNVPVFARVTRAGALNLQRRDFISAARIAGKSRLRIAVEHVLPNMFALLLVQSTLQFSLGVLAETGLSYVGLGAQPPTPSWGHMLNEAQTLTALAPSLAIFPGITIVLLILGLNLLGDGLQRPRTR